MQSIITNMYNVYINVCTILLDKVNEYMYLKWILIQINKQNKKKHGSLHKLLTLEKLGSLLRFIPYDKVNAKVLLIRVFVV